MNATATVPVRRFVDWLPASSRVMYREMSPGACGVRCHGESTVIGHDVDLNLAQPSGKRLLMHCVVGGRHWWGWFDRTDIETVK